MSNRSNGDEALANYQLRFSATNLKNSVTSYQAASDSIAILLTRMLVLASLNSILQLISVDRAVFTILSIHPLKEISASLRQITIRSLTMT